MYNNVAPTVKVMCLGCQKVYNISPTLLKKIDGEEISPQGWCANIGGPAGFIRQEANYG